MARLLLIMYAFIKLVLTYLFELHNLTKGICRTGYKCYNRPIYSINQIVEAGRRKFAVSSAANENNNMVDLLHKFICFTSWEQGKVYIAIIHVYLETSTYLLLATLLNVVLREAAKFSVSGL